MTRLDAGMPVIASVDLQLIGTWGQPEALAGHFGLIVVVCRPRRRWLVPRRRSRPSAVPHAPGVMAAARGRIGSFKHRIARLRTTPGPIPAERLRAALAAGLEDQVDHLRSPSDSFSLPAWRKWARLMTDQRNAKAWPRVFADGHGLFGSLLAIVEQRRRPGRAVGRPPARPVCRVARRGGGRARQPGTRRCGTGMATRGRPVGGAGRRGRPARPRRCRRGGRGDRDAARGGDRRRAGRSRVQRGRGDRCGDPDRYADAFPLPRDRIDEILEDLGERLGDDPPGGGRRRRPDGAGHRQMTAPPDKNQSRSDGAGTRLDPAH